MRPAYGRIRIALRRRSLGRPWRPRRPLEVHRVDRLFQPREYADVEGRRATPRSSSRCRAPIARRRSTSCIAASAPATSSPTRMRRLEPEDITSVEGGILVGHGRASVRVTAFHNVMNNAISNVTLSVTPTQTTRERQNTDEVRSSGVELEGDVRPHPRVTLSLFGAFMSADTPRRRSSRRFRATGSRRCRAITSAPA